MPFQISELVIRVTADAPEGAMAAGDKSACINGPKTCIEPPDSACRHGATTCADASACRHGATTCRDLSACRHGATTCAVPQPSDCLKGPKTCIGASSAPHQARPAELDFVLQQLRDAVASEAADAEALITA